MPANVLLIAFSGERYDPVSFLPDNGLAVLAGCLIAKGHHAYIWDCLTPADLQRLFPYQHIGRLRESVSAVITSLQRAAMPSADELDRYCRIAGEIKEYKKKKIQELGKEMAAYVARNGISFVGMKLWSGDGFAGSVLIAAEIRKRNPGILIVGGGPHVDSFMERIFDVTDAFDMLSFGEGEEVITLLADYTDGKIEREDIPNIIFRKNGKTLVTRNRLVADLNSLPPAVYDPAVYPAMEGNQKFKLLHIQDSRGCACQCSFCLHPLKSGKERREVSPVRVVDEMEYAIERYGIRVFRLSGSTPPVSLLREIAEEILRRRLAVKYVAFARGQGFSKEDFSLMQRSGCFSLAFGVESGSQWILDHSLKKSVKVEEMKYTIALCRETGIRAVTSIILPAPYETEVTKEETFQFLQQVRPDAISVMIPELVNGTEWDVHRAEYGFETEPPGGSYWKRMTYSESNSDLPGVLREPIKEYRLNGKSFLQIQEERTNFIQRLERAKLTPRVVSTNLLLSELAGMGPKDFTLFHRHCVRNGNYTEIQNMMQKVNAVISHGVQP
jgi:hypothetical protein